METRTASIPGAIPTQRVITDRDHWLDIALQMQSSGARLISLWAADERDRGDGFLLRAALQETQQVVLLELSLPADASEFPSLASVFPAATRMERAIYDLLGLRAVDGDSRPWLRHAAWPVEEFPLRRDARTACADTLATDNYRFVRVEGDGVHEIAVGPVHAGIIEPGHFRFSVVGEKVLRLEQRLGYVHKGIEKRFESLSPIEARRLAARVSGDSAAAYSWAYCMALEGICAVTPPPRGAYLRALVLERERIANHLGDLGALGNDAGFAFGLTQFSRLKEQLLRLNAALYGARYPFDEIVAGGVAHDLDAEHSRQILEQCSALEIHVRKLHDVYDEHNGLQDRFVGCGIVAPELAERLGLTGFAGRASAQPFDLRCDLPVSPYDQLQVDRTDSNEGDVAARVALRFVEIRESLGLCRSILLQLPPGPIRTELPALVPRGIGIGLIEGWRGPVFVALETDAAGAIRRCHPHDPSWHNWPVLEHAVLGNIVPDFPLINKSFNLSYSGVDL